MNVHSAINAQFPQKMECIFQPKRTKVFWGGRGAGRSWGVARFLLLEGVKRKIRVLCARELQKSIDESVHQVLSDQVNMLGLSGQYVVQKSKIFGANGTEFFFEGIKNNVTAIKSFEGIDYCWVEEANKVTKNSWGHLIPTIRKAGSELIITFNPELETDYTYERFVVKANKENSFVVHMTFRDNPWFPDVLQQEMDHDRATDEDHYNNIWEGQCLQQLEGAVFAKQLRKLSADGRIREVPYDPNVPVDVFWDLGHRHNTSLLLGQRVAMQYRVLEGYQDKGEELDYYMKWLQNRPYTYGTMYLPHDAKAKRLGMKTTVEEQVKKRFKVRIVPKMSLNDGIEAAKAFLATSWWDHDLTSDARFAIARYKFEIDQHGAYSKNPDEQCDEADYAAALRYMALMVGGSRQDRGDMLAALKSAAEATRDYVAGFERQQGALTGESVIRQSGQDWMKR